MLVRTGVGALPVVNVLWRQQLLVPASLTSLIGEDCPQPDNYLAILRRQFDGMEAGQCQCLRSRHDVAFSTRRGLCH